MKKLQIATSPLGEIFVGVPKGDMWGKVRQDMTIEALVSVAEHVLIVGEPVVISTVDGVPEYKISVEKL